jgi:hypothetical protein
LSWGPAGLAGDSPAQTRREPCCDLTPAARRTAYA